MTESTVRLPSRLGSVADMQGNDLTDHTGSHTARTEHVLYEVQRHHQLATAAIFAYMGRP